MTTGLRPGEKLYEELLIGDDASPTAHPRIMKAREGCRGWNELRPWLLELERATQANKVGVAYLFDHEQGLKGCKFVYKTPAALVKIPAQFTLQDIPLP